MLIYVLNPKVELNNFSIRRRASGTNWKEAVRQAIEIATSPNSSLFLTFFMLIVYLDYPVIENFNHRIERIGQNRDRSEVKNKFIIFQ